MAIILLLEDDDAVLAAAGRVLVSCGHEVLAARTAEEALALEAAHGPADLLVADVVLPGPDGATLARHLWEERPELRIVITSGHPPEFLDQFGPLEDFLQVLQKPFSAEQLRTAVAEALASSRPSVAPEPAAAGRGGRRTDQRD